MINDKNGCLLQKVNLFTKLLPTNNTTDLNLDNRVKRERFVYLIKRRIDCKHKIIKRLSH